MPSTEGNEAVSNINENITILQDQLYDALVKGNFIEFKTLLDSGNVRANYCYANHHYATLLEIACRNPDKGKYIDELLKKVKPNINHIIPEPIHHAAKRGIYDAIESLLKHTHINVNAVDSKGNTALHYLFSNYKDDEREKFEKCIRLLLNRNDLNINIPNKRGYTPIHQAATHEHKEIIKLLLDYCKDDLDLDSSVASGKTSREFISAKYPDLKQFLPPLKYNKLPGPPSQLIVALQNRHIDVFCGLLRQVDSYGNSLLDPNYWYGKPLSTTCLEMSCKEEDREEFVAALLEAGADPNVVNLNTEKAPIHVAAETGNCKALENLLKDGRTNVNAIDKKLRTALHYASDQKDKDKFHKSLECISFLLNEDNININLYDRDYYTPIVLAVLSDNQEAVKCMLNQKKHILNLDTPQGKEKKTGYEFITDKYPRLVLNRQECVISTEPDNENILLELLYKRHADKFIQTFSTSGIILETQTDISYKFLELAIKHNLDNVVEELLAHGANPNGDKKHKQCPPVVLAIKYECHSTLQQLLNCQNVDINATDMKGNTALHHAVDKEDLNSCIDLINHGASIKKENVLGIVPITASGLKTLLDKSLKTNKRYPKDEKYEVIFDYRFLTSHKTEATITNAKVSNHLQSNESSSGNSDLGMEMQRLFKIESNEDNHIINVNDTNTQNTNIEQDNHRLKETEHKSTTLSLLKPEMNLLHYISQKKDYKHLLNHPIIMSFLKLKWECVKHIFYLNLFFYVSFVLCLNVYIWFCQDIHEKSVNANCTHMTHPSDNYTRTGYYITYIILIVLLVLLGLRELVQFIMCRSKYMKNPENILDVSLVILTIIVLLPPMKVICYIRPTVTVAVILLSGMELILLTGRFPQLSLNIEMLKAVSRNYCWFLLSYTFLILAFAHCFYIMFKNNEYSQFKQEFNFFKYFSYSVFKTIIMMTGEFDAGNSMVFDIMPITSTVVFILFVFFIAIVLLNLLIGLTVNDTHAIQKKSKMLCIASRIHVIFEIESVIIECHRTYTEIFGKSKCINNLFQGIGLFPTSKHDKMIRTLPNINGTIEKCQISLRDFKIDNNVLEEAMKIISKQGREYEKPTQSIDQRVGNLEESVKEVLSTLKTITKQLDSIVEGQENCTDGIENDTFKDELN